MALRAFLIALFAWTAVAQRPDPVPQPRNQFAIQGELVDAVTLQPIAKADVGIAPVNDRNNFTWALTREDGRFSFDNLAAGKYTLTAQHRGYLTQALDQHEAFSSSVAVGPNLDSAHIVFWLPPECKISGTVLDEAGEPVRDAQVLLFRSGISGGMNGTREHRQTPTDDRGFYHFDHLAPGRYVLAVSARVWYAQRPNARPDTVRTTITGVTSNNYSGGGSSTYRSTSQGNSGGQGSPQEASSPSPLDVAYPITFYAGTTEPAAASPITLKQGEKFVADVSLQPVPALHLRISGSGATLPQNSYFKLNRKLFDGTSIPIITETRVTSSGAMELVGVPPGHYTTSIIDPAHLQQEQRTEELDAVTSGPAEQFDVNGAHVTVSLELDPGATRPTQSYFQLFNMNTRDYFNQQVTDKGDVEFRQPIPPGAYELALTNGRGEFIRSVSATGARALGRRVDIRSTGAVKLAVTVGHGMGQVTGTVLRDGKPFSGAMVVLVPEHPGDNGILFRRDQSDTDGTFTLAGAIPGKYTVLAIENGWELEWLKPQVLAPYLSGSTQVEVLPNGKYDVKVNVQ